MYKHGSNAHFLFTLPLQSIGEQEFTARNAGLSFIIVFSIMVPLLLLIIVISYRYIKRKNSEAETKEKEIYFAELEKERQQIYENMYGEQQRMEIDSVKYLEEHRPEIVDTSQFRSNQIPSNVIDDEKRIEKIYQGDENETDDEFFEMPLPPVPAISPKSGKLSITDNEGISVSPSTSIPTSTSQETPKANNIDSVFSFPTPANLHDNSSSRAHVSSNLPRSSANSETSDNLGHPVIIDFTPKLPLQSDF